MLRQTSGHGFSRNSISPKRRLVVIFSYTLTSLTEHFGKREVSKKNKKLCGLLIKERAPTFERIGEIMQLGRVQRLLLDDTVGVLLGRGFFREDA
jgi:hypothetical protein